MTWTPGFFCQYDVSNIEFSGSEGMKVVKSILLASHGSEGALAAEQKALSYCAEGVSLKHLVVVPEFWEGMRGDDWLNNAATRNTFQDYMDSELEKEVRENLLRVQTAVEASGADYDYKVMKGEPDKCLLALVDELDCDQVILGGLRPKGVTGLRSRMLTDKVLRELDVAMEVLPWPMKSA